MKFYELRNQISGISRLSICDKKTLGYKNFITINDVPKEYDDLFVCGIGITKSEFHKENEDLELPHCIEIIVSKDELKNTDNKSLKNASYLQYLPKEKCWAISTKNGLEKGCLGYVLGEMVLGGLIYRYRCGESMHENHSHDFEGVLKQLVKDPKLFSISGFEDDYSEQERQFLSAVQNHLLK